MKILLGLTSFLLAVISLMTIGLMGLACLAQHSMGAGKSPGTVLSIMMGPWTLSGWQIYAVMSLFVMLTIAFVAGGLYLFRSPRIAG